MTKKKRLLTRFVFVFVIMLFVFGVIPFVSADWNSHVTCPVSGNCSIVIFTVNSSNPNQNLNGSQSDCFVSVYNDDDYSNYLIFNSSMLEPNASDNLHNFTILFNDSGHYPSIIRCNGTDVDDIKDFSFEVSNAGGGTDSDWSMAVLLAFLGVIGMLGYYSQKFGKQTEELSFAVSSLNSAIRVLFFLGSLLLLLVTVNVARLVVEQVSPSSTSVITLLDVTYITLMFVFSILMTYLVIKYIFTLVVQLKDFKRQKGET